MAQPHLQQKKEPKLLFDYWETNNFIQSSDLLWQGVCYTEIPWGCHTKHDYNVNRFLFSKPSTMCKNSWAESVQLCKNYWAIFRYNKLFMSESESTGESTLGAKSQRYWCKISWDSHGKTIPVCDQLIMKTNVKVNIKFNSNDIPNFCKGSYIFSLGDQLLAVTSIFTHHVRFAAKKGLLISVVVDSTWSDSKQ